MTREQYKRANAVVYPVFIVIMGYVFLSLLAFMIFSDPSGGGVTWRTYIQIASALIGIIVSTASFIAKRDTRLCANAMVYSGLVMYIIIRLFGNTEDSCMYAFPILFATVAYLDIKMVVISNSAMLASNILRLILNMNKVNDVALSAMVVGVFVSVLVAYASIRATRILVKFNNENMEEVKSSMEETLSSSNTIYDHITQLSATSEEVAACSSEGLENSNITVAEVEKCKKIFESICELAQDLQTY